MSGHEFNPADNHTFSLLSKRINTFSVGLSLYLFVSAWIAYRNHGRWYIVLTWLSGLLLVGLLWRASKAFRRAVDTQGADILHVMSALRGLRVYFGIQAVALVIPALILMILTALAVIF
jgi:hypothetical protein